MAHTPRPRFLFNDGTIHPDSDGYRLLPNRPFGLGGKATGKLRLNDVLDC
jgi:hypothetical protein